MDILSVVTDLLGNSKGIVNSVSKETGEKKGDISNVIESALPQLVGNILGGKTSSTSTSLTSVLGKNSKGFLNDIAKKLGLTSEQVILILTAALPKIVEVLGNLTSTDTSKKTSSKKTSSSKKTGTKTSKKTSSKKTGTTTSKKTSSSKKKEKEDDGLDIGSIASSVLSLVSNIKKKK